MTIDNYNTLKSRFRGFYPVVIDVETSGFDCNKNALLEIAAITLTTDEMGWFKTDKCLHFHVKPFAEAILEPDALTFNGIDPYQPFRDDVTEYEALHAIFTMIKKGMKQSDCNRAVIVAHNAPFDHGFVMAAAQRASLKRNPFHPFATFDTAALSGLVYGQTVLAKACQAANIFFDHHEAHSALYDTQKTAELFCSIVNRWKQLGGWPLAAPLQSE